MQPAVNSHQTPSNNPPADNLYTHLAENYRAQTTHAQAADTATKQHDENLHTAEFERQLDVQNAVSHHDAATDLAERHLKMRTTAANVAFGTVKGAVMDTDWHAVVGFIGEPPSPMALNKPTEETLQTLRTQAEDIQRQMQSLRADLFDLRKQRAKQRQWLAVGMATLTILVVVIGLIVVTSLQATTDANATATQSVLDTARAVAYVNAMATQALIETATQIAYLNATATQAPLNTATRVAYLNATATQAPVETATQVSLKTATSIAYQTAVVSGRVQLTTPIVRNIQGVPMVLVPPGCFMMGSTDGKSDEQPANRQCFDKPFWIDQTDVTNAQFAQFGGQVSRSEAKLPKIIGMKTPQLRRSMVSDTS